MKIYDKLVNKEAKIAVIGLGYVGLPLAIEFGKVFDVIGFDINPKVIEKLKNKIDPAGEIEPEKFEGTNILFTYDEKDLDAANFFIIAVPTPIDEYKLPDLKPLIGACKTVGRHLKKGDYVVVESTVYPGCTEEDCVPVIEQESGLKFCKDFKVGFSPERINPGDKVHTLTNVVKVTSGCDQIAAEEISKVYATIVKAGIHQAPSIKVAEASKIVENTQRDVNIAIMNEFSKIFNHLNINTYEVIEAASTKWNFLKFSPGLVGGHCIGVDPYYLIFKARKAGYEPRLFMSARELNDSMGKHVAQNIIKLLAKNRLPVADANVLILGFTFKENVSDIRNTKVADIVFELQEYNVNVDVVDPKADKEEVKAEYGIELAPEIKQKHYDVIVAAVAHNQYKNLDEDYFISLLRTDKGIFVDIKGIFKDKIKKLTYWSL